MAWADVPQASPWATGSSILNSLKSADAVQAPKIPVNTTQATVTEGIPPISSESPMAMAVVMDFGKMDAVNAPSKEITKATATMITMQDTQPAKIPSKIAFQLDLST